ncbi:MAG: adenylate/guanylate cyclase domain-containing protein [Solirubrobacteraceae bacterium]
MSVLFCDLVDFTTFSESRDPEDVRDVLDEYFVEVRRIVGDYGGMIEKFIGDAVMAVWGAPLAHEDDAERSVRTGLEIVQAVAALARRLAVPELRVRVGVLTGEAAVTVGSLHEGMVTGDAVNTAARIQSIANPGTVLVDEITRLACKRWIGFADAGEHTLKGRSAPVRVWRALRVLDELDDAGRSTTFEPPFVGREGQLRRIAAALETLRCTGGSVRIVSVIGDAGIGKSRLGWELEQRAGRGAPIRRHRGRSVSFGEGTGLSALADVVRMALGIRRDDGVDRQRELVEQLVQERFTDDTQERRRLVRALNRLLDLDDGREPIEQGELFSAWRALFERLAAEGPVVLAFEELQLADQALLDFIAHLRDWSQAAPILILAFSRPDLRLHPLVAAADAVELGPLSDADMDQLVAGAVAGAPAVLLAAIRAEGGGIPLYAVETLRTLADRGVLAVEDQRYVFRGELGELTVPPTISALVGSRLDRLGQLERRVLTAGAVLGESFSTSAAAAIAGVEPADARVLLDGLVSIALLGFDRDPRSPLRGRYLFLQGVVRRVALSRLSRRERKRCHLAAVDYLSQPGGTEPELTAVLAGHLLAAEEADPKADDVASIRERARAMLGAAAERAAAVGALTEALSLFDRAAELAVDELDRATILERAGTVAFRVGDADAAHQRYIAAQEIHAAAGRERAQLRVSAHDLHALSYVRAPSELLPALRELDAALGEEHDAVSALARSVFAFALYQCGDHEQALSVATRAVQIAEECGDHGEARTQRAWERAQRARAPAGSDRGLAARGRARRRA